MQTQQLEAFSRSPLGLFAWTAVSLSKSVGVGRMEKQTLSNKWTLPHLDEWGLAIAFSGGLEEVWLMFLQLTWWAETVLEQCQA